MYGHNCLHNFFREVDKKIFALTFAKLICKKKLRYLRVYKSSQVPPRAPTVNFLFFF